MNNYFNKLIKKLNIVKIISEFVKLEECGNNYKGFSPFKKETNPSFMVSPTKKIWKDFSSGKGGTLVKFIMYIFNYNYYQAINYLINKYYKYNIKNINFKKNNNLYKKENNFLFIINKILININKLYVKFLFNNKKVYKYLIKRNLNKKTIKKFNIGYSPSNISIKSFFIKNKIKFNDYILNNIGIFTIINKKFYYLFKNRIMFPIKNINGNIIGFGGRNFDLSVKINKYINSRNNLFFNKSKILYGLYETNKYISINNSCYIVEGYMDLLSLYNANIKNVVATLGTNISQYHIDLIKKYTDNVILLYDGDNSGIDAVIKNIIIFFKNDINIRLFYFKDNEDPSSYIQHNKLKNNINNYFLKNSKNFIDYFFIIYKKELNDPFLKYKLLSILLKKILYINNNIVKEFYIQKIIKKFKISKKYVYNEIYKINKIHFSKTINIEKRNSKEKEEKNNKKISKKINLKLKIEYYNNIIFNIIKKYYKLRKYNLIYKYNNKNKIIYSYNILKYIFNILKKYKINFYHKSNNLYLNIIKKNNIKFKKLTYKKNKRIIKYKNIKYIFKENALKYKYYIVLKTINIHILKIKINRNNTYYLNNFYNLIKEKNHILDKIYNL
ncbi:MAG: DNA primase [Candidatus Shikimatogenerans bostrichidophilus]|nr:MAG: DNA primase [Candidatus Shikimatogenerans bostrichidophilus]